MRGERRNKQANELKASAHPGLAAEPRPGGEGPGGEDSKTWDPEDLFYPEVILLWQLIEELGQAHKPQYPYKSEGFRRVPRKDSDNPGTMGQNGLFQVIGLVSKGKINEENISIFKFSLHLESIFGCGFLWLIIETLLRSPGA